MSGKSSRGAVLHGYGLTDGAQEQTISHAGPEASEDASNVARLLLAAKNDLDAFKRIPGWPRHPIELGLKMTRGESSQAFHASALANAIVTFNEIVLIAAPGTGKTTTLLQVAEAILSSGTRSLYSFRLASGPHNPIRSWHQSRGDMPFLEAVKTS